MAVSYYFDAGEKQIICQTQSHLFIEWIVTAGAKMVLKSFVGNIVPLEYKSPSIWKLWEGHKMHELELSEQKIIMCAHYNWMLL